MSGTSQVPNLGVKDGLDESNDFIKAYLADQQATYQKAIEIKQQIMSEEPVVVAPSAAVVQEPVPVVEKPVAVKSPAKREKPADASPPAPRRSSGRLRTHSRPSESDSKTDDEHADPIKVKKPEVKSAEKSEVEEVKPKLIEKVAEIKDDHKEKADVKKSPIKDGVDGLSASKPSTSIAAEKSPTKPVSQVKKTVEVPASIEKAEEKKTVSLPEVIKESKPAAVPEKRAPSPKKVDTQKLPIGSDKAEPKVKVTVPVVSGKSEDALPVTKGHVKQSVEKLEARTIPVEEKPKTATKSVPVKDVPAIREEKAAISSEPVDVPTLQVEKAIDPLMTRKSRFEVKPLVKSTDKSAAEEKPLPVIKQSHDQEKHKEVRARSPAKQVSKKDIEGKADGKAEDTPAPHTKDVKVASDNESSKKGPESSRVESRRKSPTKAVSQKPEEPRRPSTSRFRSRQSESERTDTKDSTESDKPAPARKRRWGSSKGDSTSGSSASKREGLSRGISSDSLKGLISDVNSTVQVSNKGADDTEKEVTPTTPTPTTLQISAPVFVSGQSSGATTTSASGKENGGTVAVDKRDIKFIRVSDSELRSNRDVNVDKRLSKGTGVLPVKGIDLNKADSATEEPAQPREPSPAKNEPSNILFVRNLTRPFTVNQLNEVLSKHGQLNKEKFWIDKIKSRCYATYQTVEEATNTREALHGMRWPDANPKTLSVDFATEDDLTKQVEADKAPPLPPPKPATDVRENIIDSGDKLDVVIRRDKGDGDAREQRDVVKRPIREWDRDKLAGREGQDGQSPKRRRSRSPRNRGDVSDKLTKGKSSHYLKFNRY